MFVVFRSTQLLVDFHVSYYIHAHTFSQRADTYTVFSVSTRTYTHTHIYVSTTLPHFPHCVDSEHTYTQICSSNPHSLFTERWNYTHPYTYIPSSSCHAIITDIPDPLSPHLIYIYIYMLTIHIYEYIK